MPSPPSTRLSAVPPSRRYRSTKPRRPALIEVIYPRERGTIGLRGNEAPLSWEVTFPPTRSEGDRQVFEVSVPEDDILDFKIVRNDEDWSTGRNYMVHAGDHLHIDAYFDATRAELLAPETVEHAGRPMTFQVLLPPSYGEQTTKRYPVLVVMDGQSMWTVSDDPYGVWKLDDTLNELFELSAIEELIVVAIDNSVDRAERLSPMPDPEGGGGHAKQELDAIIDAVLPLVRERFRTKTDSPRDTGILGSSMGGLFAFYAAWTRPEVFGKAACLSSSFWWGNRQIVRDVQETEPRSPDLRPLLYLDTGASKDPLEEDASARDGFHHTRSMYRALLAQGYVAGRDLHRLAFTGQQHEAPAWGARVGIPLQILFPPPATSQIPRDDVRVDASCVVVDHPPPAPRA
jgi:predicted alpha/beta superfamily hydrolase